jgi:aryl-alcohol dehydrogenase-like predicted oxidoreductase
VKLRQLGVTQFETSPVGFGAWQIGGSIGRLGWPSQADEVSVAAIHAALDAGVNWIDTAPIYGQGHSEEIVGRAIRGLSDPPLVFTKCGLPWDEHGGQRCDLSRASIRCELRESLRRLRLEAIDLYQIHWPIPDEGVEEAWSTLLEMKRDGLVREIGVSNFTVGQLDRARAIGPVASLQPPYSLLDRRIERDVLPYCAAHGIGVIVYSPLASGLLSGSVTRARLLADPADWRREDPLFNEPHFSEHLEFVARLQPIALDNGVSVAQLAVAWTLRGESVTGAMVGFSRPAQVGEIIAAGSIVLKEDVLAQIDQAASATLVSPPAEPRLVPPADG